jgi:DNA-binding PadR family transcriptional regulator
MLAAGLIDRARAPSTDHDPRRRYYGLTPLGRHVLEEETGRLARMVEAARARNVLRRLAPR